MRLSLRRRGNRTAAGVTFVVAAAVFMLVLGPVAHAAAPTPLQITKTADAASVNAGDQIGYTITVSNPGAKSANAFVADTLPTNAGTAWTISPAVSGCTISSGTLNCAAKVAPAGTFSVHISSPTTTATCGTVSNQASVTAPGAGTTTSQTATIIVQCAPSFTATLVTDGACGFTLAATWANAQVDHVVAQWNLDGSFLFTMEAPGTGPNGGTIIGNTATFNAGPFATTADLHVWNVRVQFYYQGAFVAEVFSNDVTVPCGVGS